MSLITQINKYCPVGISHSHRLGTKERNNKNSCILCSGLNNQINFGYCPFYFKETIESLSKNAVLSLKYCLSKSEEYYLPNELQEIIIDFCKYSKKENNLLTLNQESIHHMMKCRKCSSKFVEWLDDNTCNNHMLPRRNLNNNDLFF